MRGGGGNLRNTPKSMVPGRNFKSRRRVRNARGGALRLARRLKICGPQQDPPPSCRTACISTSSRDDCAKARVKLPTFWKGLLWGSQFQRNVRVPWGVGFLWEPRVRGIPGGSEPQRRFNKLSAAADVPLSTEEEGETGVVGPCRP